jgi:hypothetical protein
MQSKEHHAAVRIHTTTYSMASRIIDEILTKQCLIKIAEIWVDEKPFWHVDMQDKNNVIIS